jgi:geranylgeranyl pyrophosphate synthase
MAARAEEHSLLALRDYGEHLGLAFQIADDLLDVTSTAASLGKSTGKDAELGKSTYVSLLGVAEAGRLANRHKDSAVVALERAGLRTPLLEGLATFVLSRRS